MTKGVASSLLINLRTPNRFFNRTLDIGFMDMMAPYDSRPWVFA